MKCSNIDQIDYSCRYDPSLKDIQKSISVIGIDTETLVTGECFLICTSLGNSFTLEEFPRFLFSRQYQNQNFVAYNLKFDEGSFLQIFNNRELEELRKGRKVDYNGYIFSIIPGKCLTIRRKKNSIHIYDLYNFYTASLDYNAEKYLGENKLELETKSFSTEYVEKNWERIVEYCIKDAVLVQKLGQLIIERFESLGIFVTKLYSTAYVSYQYFRRKCKYPVVKNLWDHNKLVLEYALKSYSGGKFEVTQKGVGYYYEYDIISAYPHEIANLVDISNARVAYDNHYRKTADYGFLNAIVTIPPKVFSPVAIMKKGVNIFPVGVFHKHITKNEYDYIIKYGGKVEIIDAVWLYCQTKEKPFQYEIERLTKLKEQFGKEGKMLDRHTVKILMNSLYGKMIQLIPQGDRFKASACFNPIYAAVITANVRIRISELQQKFRSVIAVHTDSIISTEKLDFPEKGELGDMTYEVEGNGVVIGAGIYQIGKKKRFRCVKGSEDLLEICQTREKKLPITNRRPRSWKEVAFRNLPNDEINRFFDDVKDIRCDFDTKRIWIRDAESYYDLLDRRIYSAPFAVFELPPKRVSKRTLPPPPVEQ